MIPTNPYTYRLPWGKSTLTITLLVLLLLLFLCFIADIDKIFVAVASVPLFLAWLRAPYSIRVDTQTIQVKRPFGSITIDADDVRKIVPIAPEDIKKMVRTWGNGGLFGFYGRFYSPRLGNFRLYTCKLSSRHLVLIETLRSGKYVIYCKDVDHLKVLIGYL